MHDDLSPEQLASLEALSAEFEREAARVGVDWDLAAPALRELAFGDAPMPVGEEGEMVLGLDLTELVAALRALPDHAGTAAFIAAQRRRSADPSAPPA